MDCTYAFPFRELSRHFFQCHKRIHLASTWAQHHRGHLKYERSGYNGWQSVRFYLQDAAYLNLAPKWGVCGLSQNHIRPPPLSSHQTNSSAGQTQPGERRWHRKHEENTSQEKKKERSTKRVTGKRLKNNIASFFQPNVSQG